MRTRNRPNAWRAHLLVRATAVPTVSDGDIFEQVRPLVMGMIGSFVFSEALKHSKPSKPSAQPSEQPAGAGFVDIARQAASHAQNAARTKAHARTFPSGRTLPGGLPSLATWCPATQGDCDESCIGSVCRKLERG